MSFSTSTIGVFTGTGTSYRSVANALTRVFCGISKKNIQHNGQQKIIKEQSKKPIQYTKVAVRRH
jgi:hypothetical protein